MTDPTAVGSTAGEQARASRRWGLRRARMGVIAGTIAPAASLEAAASRLDSQVAVAEPSTREVTVVSVPGSMTSEPAGRAPRRRLRWIGWISRRVFHGPTDPKFT